MSNGSKMKETASEKYPDWLQGRHLSINDDVVEWPLAVTMFFLTEAVIIYALPGAIVTAWTLFSLTFPLIVAALRGKLKLYGKYSIPLLLLFTAFIAVFFVSTARNPDFIVRFIYRMAVMFPLTILFFATREEGHTFSVFYKFESITIVFCYISLFFWIFGELLGVIPPIGTFNIVVNGNDVVNNFYYLHFTPQGYRNCGAFREAPMYNLVLCTSLFTELFLRPKSNRKRVAILVITILTTLSTTGQLVLLLLVFLKIVKSKVYSQLSLLSKIAIGFFAIAAIAASIAIGIAIMVEKADGLSFAVRAEHMLAEIKAFASSPIRGNGYGSYYEGSSNSICLILAEGGLVAAALYVWGLIIWPLKLAAASGNSKFKWFGLFYFAIFSITISTYIPLTLGVIALHLSWPIANKNRLYQDIAAIGKKEPQS